MRIRWSIGVGSFSHLGGCFVYRFPSVALIVWALRLRNGNNGWMMMRFSHSG
ncbi:hypothetical protein BDW59DRAFT_146518 [Aspergillus cavernicola]|uniref:Uncharacterized protein n=1 Tax=Aspergillus cavernicola TaxID=176166 RepID=A0ABR4ID01_9EURO